MKICIISPKGYPVPATKGGAIETLIQSLIEENEIYKRLDIVCVARYDKEAKRKSKKYNNTKFEYFKMIPEKLKILNFIFNLTCRVLKKITHKNYKELLHCKIIARKIKKYDFDFIIVEGGIPLSYKKLLSQYNKNKVILHIHGGDMIATKELSDVYGYYMTLSEFLKNKFSSSGYVKKDKVFVVHNGINVDLFSEAITDDKKDELKQLYGINKDDIVILFCGRLIKEKGVLELIESINRIKDKEKIKLLIIGNSEFGNNATSEYERKLHDIAHQLKDQIIFTGYIHNSNLNMIYKIADIGVVPSIWEEASPLVVVEQMVGGLPLVVTDSGGIPELVNDKCAFIIKRDKEIVKNISEKLEFLIKNKEKRLEMGKNGAENGSKYSIKQFYQEFANVLEKIKTVEDGNNEI